jgi:subtilisin family serine protease
MACRRFALLCSAAFLLFGPLGLSAATPERAFRENGALLIKVRGGNDSPASTRVQTEFQHRIRRRFETFGWQQIDPPPGASMETVAARYRRHADVLAVEPDRTAVAIHDLPALSFTAAGAGNVSSPGLPDDPLFPTQWALAKIGAPVAWLNQTGSSNIVVAVIDTGVNYFHEDLIDNLWRNPDEIPGNGLDDDGNGWVDDIFGVDTASGGNDSDPFDRGANGYYHGSLIAGIIGAAAGNRRGVAGINWSVRIMAVRAIGANNLITIGNELEALNYVLLMKNRGVNIRAVNMSYGGLPYSLAERDALAALSDAGILLCAAAGNSGTNNDVTPNYPSSHSLPGIIAVAATDEADLLAVFPFSGSSHFGRTNVDLAAPGLHVVSTFGPSTNDYDAQFFGTSAATPHVTGAVALLAAANPYAEPHQIKSALLESVDMVPALTNKLVSHGRLNLARALDHPLIATGPPTIARSPGNQAIVLSNRVDLLAIVYGAKPRELQWYFDGRPLPSATNASLVISSVSFSDEGDYTVVVTNAFGMATGLVARLAVLPLQITNQPAEQVIRTGNTARFSVGVSSPAPVNYHWSFNGMALSNATNASLNLTNVQWSHDGLYSVTVSNQFGRAVSDGARLTVLVNPTITVPPISQSIVQGGDATFSVGMSGNPMPFGVQWLEGTVPRASNTVAAFQDFFVISNARPAQAGTWRVRLRNAATANAVERTFTVQILPDADGDGLPDAWERIHGLQTNDVSDALADADADGFSNRDEYRAGTQPTNALSFLAIDPIVLTNSSVVLGFAAVSNKTYTLESRTNANEPVWHRVGDFLASPTNRTVQWLDSFRAFETTRQYRVRTPRAP